MRTASCRFRFSEVPYTSRGRDSQSQSTIPAWPVLPSPSSMYESIIYLHTDHTMAYPSQIIAHVMYECIFIRGEGSTYWDLAWLVTAAEIEIWSFQLS